jgi:hypothetical protein
MVQKYSDMVKGEDTEIFMERNKELVIEEFVKKLSQ